MGNSSSTFVLVIAVVSNCVWALPGPLQGLDTALAPPYGGNDFASPLSSVYEGNDSLGRRNPNVEISALALESLQGH